MRNYDFLRKNTDMNEGDISLLRLCDRFTMANTPRTRKSTMDRILNVSLERSAEDPDLGGAVSDAIVTILGLAEVEKKIAASDLPDHEKDALWKEIYEEALDELMITSVYQFELFPQRITEFYKKKYSNGFEALKEVS